jgi:hypothetical protein
VRNTLAFIAGVVALAVAKYVATRLGAAMIPPPTGVDLSTLEGFKAAIPLYEASQWLPAFFEHAVGSMAGGAVAALLAASHRMTLALGIGGLHLLGGLAAAFMLPFPAWVVVVDLGAMYLPMAWIGGRLARAISLREIAPGSTS